VEIKRIDRGTCLEEGYNWLEERQLDIAILNYAPEKMRVISKIKTFKD